MDSDGGTRHRPMVVASGEKGVPVISSFGIYYPIAVLTGYFLFQPYLSQHLLLKLSSRKIGSRVSMQGVNMFYNRTINPIFDNMR